MNEPKNHRLEQPAEHLFSPHTDLCFYCGQSAKDDLVENTPCNRPCCQSCRGQGWLFCNTGNDQAPAYGIQRCDACGLYENDQAALEAVVETAKSQWQLLQFVKKVSELTHEGESSDDGQPFNPTSEDAIATLNALILEARQLLGAAERCDECGEVVPYVIGCQDGAEICQECFDAGQH